MREVLVDGEGEVKASPLVHAFIGLDSQGEVEDVVGIGKLGAPGSARFQFFEIYRIRLVKVQRRVKVALPFWTRS
jgi:hypothetical protein